MAEYRMVTDADLDYVQRLRDENEHLRSILKRLWIEAINGVVCTPPGGQDEQGREIFVDVNASLDRLWCGSCRAIWKDIEAVIRAEAREDRGAVEGREDG